jgi:DNA-binding NarL/FixJ family response regulator
MSRLLLVGERSALAPTLRAALRHAAGFRVVGFLDARAVSGPAVSRLAPDVVLVDDMGRPSDALAAVRGIAEGVREAQVLLLTGDRSAEWQRLAFEAGAHALLARDMEPRALGTLINLTAHGALVHRAAPGAAAPVAVLPTPGLDSLTEREREILGLVAEGLTNAVIARRLWVSEPTVKFHLANLYRKLGVANRTEASRYAHVHGLVAPPPAVLAAA